MKPYSKDLRIGVLAAVDRGVPREEAARTFSVSVPTIKRWLKRRRETGDVEPRPIPGRPSVKGAALEGWLPTHLRENDDLTLAEHREAFEEAHGGAAVSAPTIKRWLKRRRETGDVGPRPIPGRPSVKGAALEGWLPSHLRENDDLTTLAEHREAFEEARGGAAVSASTVVGRAIARLPGGWPLEKSRR